MQVTERDMNCSQTREIFKLFGNSHPISGWLFDEKNVYNLLSFV